MNQHPKVSVADIKLKYENLSNSKPAVPPKTYKIIQGRVVKCDDVETESNDSVDNGPVFLRSEDCRDTLKKGLFNHLKEKDESESESDGVADLEPQLSKTDLVTKECIDHINMVKRSLENVALFRTDLQEVFKANEDIIKNMNLVFKDIESLKQLYQLINDNLSKITVEKIWKLPDLFLDQGVSAHLRMYKSFLSSYAQNAKWLGELQRSQYNNFNCALNKAREANGIDAMVSVDSCLYTVFNSLFSYELFFARYKKCFDEDTEQYTKAEEVKKILAKLLADINTSQDKENFFTTQKELSLLSGRQREPKINSRFLFKGEVKKRSKRDGKLLSRQLVLFSDCLYLTLQPNNITGQCGVRNELSLEGMQCKELEDEEDKISSLDESVAVDNNNNNNNNHNAEGGSDDSAQQNREGNWSLNIKSVEDDVDFQFESKDDLETWKNKIRSAIKSFCSEQTVEDETNQKGVLATLGRQAPRWQKDGTTRFCNGLRCDKEFRMTARRHHCRADGLLYCDACCNQMINLPFDRKSESRVCQLCYKILSSYLHMPQQLETARGQLELVFKKKTREGRFFSKIKVCTYMKDNQRFSSSIDYHMLLEQDPFISLFLKKEDKRRETGIMLVGMELCTRNPCKIHPELNANEFCIEHQDRVECYLFKCKSDLLCSQWKTEISQCLSDYLNDPQN